MSKRKCRRLERSFQFRAGDKVFDVVGGPAEFADAEFVFAEFCRQCGARLSLGPSNDEIPTCEQIARWIGGGEHDVLFRYLDPYTDGKRTEWIDGQDGWPWDPTRPVAGQYEEWASIRGSVDFLCDESVGAPRVAMSDVEPDNVAELCALVKDAGLTMKLNGVPVSESELRDGVGRLSIERMVNAVMTRGESMQAIRSDPDAFIAPTASAALSEAGRELDAAIAYHAAAEAALDEHGYLRPGESPAEVVGLLGPLPDAPTTECAAVSASAAFVCDESFGLPGRVPSLAEQRADLEALRQEMLDEVEPTDSDAPAATYEPGGTP